MRATVDRATIKKMCVVDDALHMLMCPFRFPKIITNSQYYNIDREPSLRSVRVYICNLIQLFDSDANVATENREPVSCGGFVWCDVVARSTRLTLPTPYGVINLRAFWI